MYVDVLRLRRSTTYHVPGRVIFGVDANRLYAHPMTIASFFANRNATVDVRMRSSSMVDRLKTTTACTRESKSDRYIDGHEEMDDSR